MATSSSRRPSSDGSTYFDEGQVEIAAHLVYDLDPDGKQLRVVRYTDYAADSVRTLCPTAPELRARWADAGQRSELIRNLTERGIDFTELAETARQPDADPFDLLCQLNKICPGSAGRNRVLNIKRLPEVLVPLPTLVEQRHIVARIDRLNAEVETATHIRRQASEESIALGHSILSSLLDVPVAATAAAPFRVAVGDVFIVRGNGSKRLCGRAGWVATGRDGLIFPDLFIRVKLPHDRMIPEFFVAVWNSRDVRTYIEEQAKTTSGIWKINQGHILSTPIPVPPLHRQEEILAKLRAFRDEAAQLAHAQAETAAELDALMPAILDRALKGEL